MLSAVTLSRSPPRADTTMMATGERSRICRHSSKPSTSGSIRSSRTMSGSSVSSSCRARIPSTETTVSKPRTARFDLIRSTMLGSSSTTSARVFLASSDICFHREVDTETRAWAQALQLHPATVRLDDALGDGQPEPGSRAARPPPAGRLERCDRDLVGHAHAVVGHTDHDLGGRPAPPPPCLPPPPPPAPPPPHPPPPPPLHP